MDRTERLTKAFDEARAICEEHNIPIGCVPSVKENKRLTSTWGRCRKLTAYTYEIEISSRLLADDVEHEALMNTMLHELLHTCKGCMNHGELWKRHAAKLNKAGWNIERCTSSETKHIKEPPRIYRYRVTCEECGDVWNYTKRGAVVRSLQRDAHSCKCLCGSRNFKLENLM